MHSSAARRTLALAAVAGSLLACSKADDAAADSAAAETAAAQATPAPPATAATAPADAPLAVSDIDVYERGLRAELQAVQDAYEAKKKAKTAADTMQAIGVSMRLDSAGAAGAGVDSDRYRRIKSKMQELVGVISPALPFDTTKMTKAERDQMRPQITQTLQMMEAGRARVTEGVPADVLEALKPRAKALSELNLRVAGELMRVAQ
jgi:hypothetical protein